MPKYDKFDNKNELSKSELKQQQTNQLQQQLDYHQQQQDQHEQQQHIYGSTTAQQQQQDLEKTCFGWVKIIKAQQGQHLNKDNTMATLCLISYKVYTNNARKKLYKFGIVWIYSA